MKYGALLYTFLLLAPAAYGQAVGTCEHGEAEAFLDVNNVRAAIYNNGNLFWRGSGVTYTVPKHDDVNAVFAAQLWMAGKVDGELRMNATDYGPWTFWPGPLDADAQPPERCSDYDRIYRIDRDSLLHFEQTGHAPRDLREWPAHLGAPVIDGDGVDDNYDLQAGDRPALVGDQMLWWVMNDRGNRPYRRPGPDTSVAAVGLEVRATAFAMRDTPVLRDHPLISSINQALLHTTFYRYELIYRGRRPLEDAWVGLWIDYDLGNAGDDFVGSDSTLGLGFVYNGDDTDQHGYGERPPAAGADFFQGPRLLPDGVDNDRDGVVDEQGERAGMQAFWLYHKGIFNPRDPSQTYLAMQGLWPDGSPMQRGGSWGGYRGNEGGGTTRYMFSGNPPAFWSEEKLTTDGSRSIPSDRRIMMSSGPFRLEPGEREVIVVGIVWARGRDRLDSVYRLKFNDALIQSVLHEVIEPRLPDISLPDPTRYAMMRNHPNPLTDRTTISYELPQEEAVRLTVFDVLGRRIATLIDRTQAAGIHSVEFSTAGLPAGVYVYRLEAGLVSGAGSMIVVR